jgi:myo-inositol-1(or 4)-monophosphatase
MGYMDITKQTELEQNLYDSTIKYVKEIGIMILDRLGNTGEIEQKKNAYDLVTEVDRLSEEQLTLAIHNDYPGHWILSEEDTGQANAYEAFKAKQSGYGWIIDPIDGTTNFINRIPHYAISIGIVKDGQPIIGVVYNPMTNELYTARKSFGAYLNGTPLRVGTESKLTDAVLGTGFQALDWKAGSRLNRQIDQLSGKSRNVRILGSASLDLCWTASGRLTGFWHEGLSPWDAAAGILILEEAGGCVTDRDGNPYSLYNDSLIATNKKIHDELLKVIKL